MTSAVRPPGERLAVVPSSTGGTDAVVPGADGGTDNRNPRVGPRSRPPGAGWDRTVRLVRHEDPLLRGSWRARSTPLALTARSPAAQGRAAAGWLLAHGDTDGRKNELRGLAQHP